MTARRHDLLRRIADAYRWHRRLGARVLETPHCGIVGDADHPDVWDCNHADDVRARTPSEIDAVFAAMDEHLSHTRWRIVHTDAFTPDPFLARLAFEDFRERPITIQMALEGSVVATAAPPFELREVESDVDWAQLGDLVRLNHAEGHATGGLEISEEVSAGLLAGYRVRSPACRFYLIRQAGASIAYGSCAAAPNGVGMIEDLFTLPPHRRKGVASAMIAAFVARLRSDGCDAVFLGALADEAPKRLYRRLGFEPAAVALHWVKETLKSAR